MRQLLKNLAAWSLLPFILLVVSCTNRQETVTVHPPDPAPAAEVIPLDEMPEPEFILRARQRHREKLQQDAELLFRRGELLFRLGRQDQGRLYFGYALGLLEQSGLIQSAPSIGHTYQSLTNRARRLEILAAIEIDEPPFPSSEVEGDLSPLDHIADLDLFTVEVDPELEDLVDEDLQETVFDFPVVVNNNVLRFLDYYQGRGRKMTEEALRRSGRYLETFQKIFDEEGVPRDLVYMAHVESLFKSRAYSRAHARGIWQFIAGTARLYDLEVGWWLDERLDFLKATRSAARHLRDLKAEFGDWYLALAAYNGGPGRVSRVLRRYGAMDYWTMARRRLLPRETRNYVPSILAAIIIYKNPQKYGFNVEPDPPLEYDTVTVDYQVDLKVIAESIGVAPQVIEDLNPELQRRVTPYDGEGFSLKVPAGSAGRVARELAEIPPEKRLRLVHHRVRQGETLSHISARYGVPIRAIADVNRLRNIHRLSLGQDLIVPLSEWRAPIGGSVGPPATGEHVVRRGESLYKIARRYGVALQDLFRWNNLGPRDVIYPGQEIRVSAND